jgi:WD40 repeat protein
LTRFNGEKLLTSQEIQNLETLINNPHLDHPDLSLELLSSLLQKGIVVTFQQDNSPASLAVLSRIAAGTLAADVRELALKALSEYAISGSLIAIDALYRLAIKDFQIAARQLITSHKLQPSRPSLKALFAWLVMQDTTRPATINLVDLTTAYFEDASPELKGRLISQAERSPEYKKWAQIIIALKDETFEPILDLYPSLSETEQKICFTYLTRLSLDGNPAAQEVICQLFILWEDPEARDLALKHGFLPTEPYQQALFYFLLGDIEKYQQIDFDHSLLVTAYELSSTSLRRRLLAFSRQSGYIDWLRSTQSTNEVRWLAELSDADWQLAIQHLNQKNRHEELWKLAQVAPPLWSATILANLARTEWLPNTQSEKHGYQELSALARDCVTRQLEVKPFKVLHSLSDDITILALNPQSSLLAAGSSGQPIHLWELPTGNLRFPALIGPASTTRSLVFSPDDIHLVAASGDHRIRLFRHQNGQIIKTLDGHHGLVRDLVIHPNGRLLLSASFDGTIRYWRFPIGGELKKIDTDIRELFALAILSEGEMVASAGAGPNISIWSIPEGTLLRRFPGEKEGILHLASDTHSDLLTGAGRGRVISVWNVSNGNVVRHFPEQPSQITGLCFHPNQQLIISSGSDGKIYLWNISTGTQVSQIKAHPYAIVSMTISSDGNLLVTADEKGTVLLWDLSAFIWLRMAYQSGKLFPLASLTEKLHDSSLPMVENKWLLFTSALWKWAQRFDIEVSEPLTIQIGDFDIEL